MIEKTVSNSTISSVATMSLSHSALAALKRSLDNTAAEVVVPGDAKYEGLIERWSEAAKKRASAVILPTTADEVSATVKIASENKIPFVVAGGRHSTGGASSVDDGLVIDLRQMRRVTIDTTKKTITAQGGCIWQDVDEAAAKYGLATPGGTVNHTGIGGLTLGGGYAWLSGKYGLVVDVLISAKMVLADGKVVTASESENADLFWAIRGCGAAFGVAVEFTYQGFDQGPVWGGLLILSPDKLASVVTFANKLESEDDEDYGMVMAFSAPPPANAPCILVALFYNGIEAKATDFFADLLALESLVNTTSTIAYEKANSTLNGAAQFGGRKTGGGSAVKLPLDEAWVQDVYDDFMGFITTQEGASHSAILFEFLPYKKVCEKPFDATAHGNRGEYYNVSTVFKWDKQELDGEMRAYSRKLHTKIREGGKTAAMKGVGAYSNYVDYPSTPEKVFGANTARLVELKKRYDPQNVFFRWHNLLAEST